MLVVLSGCAGVPKHKEFRNDRYKMLIPYWATYSATIDDLARIDNDEVETLGVHSDGYPVNGQVPIFVEGLVNIYRFKDILPEEQMINQIYCDSIMTDIIAKNSEQKIEKVTAEFIEKNDKQKEHCKLVYFAFNDSEERNSNEKLAEKQQIISYHFLYGKDEVVAEIQNLKDKEDDIILTALDSFEYFK